MDWYNNSSKRSSITTGQPTFPSPAFHGTIMTNNNITASASLSNNPTSYLYSHKPSIHQLHSHSHSHSHSHLHPHQQSPQQLQLLANQQTPNLNLPGQSSIPGRNMSPISHSASPVVSMPTTPLERNSYYFSQFPLYASDWVYLNSSQLDCIALGSYKEGFTNKLEIVHGNKYENEYGVDNLASPGGSTNLMYNNSGGPGGAGGGYYEEEELGSVEGYYFQKVCDVNLDYPVTHLQWDPLMLLCGSTTERLAASSEVLRLYKVVDNGGDSYSLQQTHTLANNTAASSTSSNSTNSSHSAASKAAEDINTYPPVTSFDWNKADPNILITSSVDTTCTVWDLHRSHPRTSTMASSSTTSATTVNNNNNNNSTTSNDDMTDTATVKTQLIAHDSEVFDVKFMHKSTNVFASVGNDGSMRVFDLRSLEHSTIIYEPPPVSVTSTSSSTTTSSTIGNPNSSTFNSKALLTLTTSNIDQHHLATVGINSNQVIVIDMRMPGIPVVTIDGSLGGITHSLINSIKWHPTSNYLLTGGDDCQALVWDINNLPSSGSAAVAGSSSSNGSTNGNGGHASMVIDTPVLAYTEDLEINNVCWRQNQGDWMGVVSGKGFQAVLI
ncbi:hypothetical protein Cantr_10166 [Candida viswanathii]|uniref:WD repeat-containing protein n=1 Tax=Candida viswanathii TaxID=5486 RepID=A0A367YC44_9ASCO|nr:hypothetical protein Cantr_10166 [Candida viswanathii]